MKVPVILLFIGCWLAGGSMARGHGVEARRVEGAVAVQMLYEEGRPMAFCDAVAHGPDEEEEYLAGTTDRQGVFSFVPDRPGVWTVVVDDGMGHFGEALLDIDEEGGMNLSARPGRGRWSAAMVGVSLIFGIFGVWTLATQRWGRAPCT